MLPLLAGGAHSVPTAAATALVLLRTSMRPSLTRHRPTAVPLLHKLGGPLSSVALQPQAWREGDGARHAQHLRTPMRRDRRGLPCEGHLTRAWAR